MGFIFQAKSSYFNLIVFFPFVCAVFDDNCAEDVGFDVPRLVRRPPFNTLLEEFNDVIESRTIHRRIEQRSFDMAYFVKSNVVSDRFDPC